ncbi:MAG: hypothetical protein AB8F26_02770 [Phycisphaerales bacterium]
MVLLLLGACTSQRPETPKVELPELGVLIESHDARVLALDSFWARASVRVEGRDAEGSKFSEQGEGHLQVERPDHVAINLGKLGEMYFALGSNEDRYWLIDVSDSSRRLIVFGSQSQATPEKAAMLGLPVHPRDIPLLLGLMPLEGRDLEAPAFNENGQVVVGIATRWGRGELRFDPLSLDLIGTAAFDANKALLAEAELSRHGPVADANGSGVVGRMPRKIEMRVPGFDGFVRMVLDDARNRPINAAVFNPDRLERGFRVRERIDLDKPRVSEESSE